MFSVQTCQRASLKMQHGSASPALKPFITYEKTINMESMFPIPLLPIWIIGAPLIAIFLERLLTPSSGQIYNSEPRTAYRVTFDKTPG